jgi:uncharacterized protein YqeY
MPLEQELNQLLKQAMFAKDQQTTDVLRMIKTKIMERRTAPGFKGQVDDPLIQDVIATYQKSLRKAMDEYKDTGDRGAEMRKQLEFEIAYCDRFLPKKLDEAATRALVKETIAKTGATQAGRLMGEIMKTHKGQVDAALVKKIAEEELAPPKS